MPDHRQCDIRHARQLTLDDCALDLEPDEHEEDRGQPVVNPQQQRLGDGKTTDLDRDREIQELRYIMSRAASSPRRERSRPAAQRTTPADAGRLQLEELLKRGQGCKGRAFTRR